MAWAGVRPAEALALRDRLSTPATATAAAIPDPPALPRLGACSAAADAAAEAASTWCRSWRCACSQSPSSATSTASTATGARPRRLPASTSSLASLQSEGKDEHAPQQLGDRHCRGSRLCTLQLWCCHSAMLAQHPHRPILRHGSNRRRAYLATQVAIRPGGARPSSSAAAADSTSPPQATVACRHSFTLKPMSRRLRAHSRRLRLRGQGPGVAGGLVWAG